MSDPFTFPVLKKDPNKGGLNLEQEAPLIIPDQIGSMVSHPFRHDVRNA